MVLSSPERYLACFSPATPFRPGSLSLRQAPEPSAEVRTCPADRLPCRQHMSASFLEGSKSGFSLQTLCTVRVGLLWGTMTPLRMRWSFSLSDSLILKIFLLPHLVRINPLVKVRATGVEFRFGPAELRFSVVHPHRSTHLPPPAGDGAAASSTVDRDPVLDLWVSRDLALPSRPQGFGMHFNTPACQPQPQVGWGGHLAKDLHFSLNQHDATQPGGGGCTHPEALASIQASLA